jgi:histidinol-phosphatase
MHERQELLHFALDLAGIAQREILPRYRSAAVSRKADGSEVTEADRNAEAAIRAAIAARYPQHAVLGEEFGLTGDAGASRRWVIDPLDGTAWFTLGMPLFGTLIALVEDGDPVIGVVHMPVLGETTYAARGLGCWFRAGDDAPRRVRVSSRGALANAVVSASGLHGSDIAPAAQARYALTPVVRGAAKFRLCGDCQQHALVCRGNLDAAIDTIMAPWDIAAIVPCVEEAGGVATSLAGHRDGIVDGGSLLSSADAALHREILDILGGR